MVNNTEVPLIDNIRDAFGRVVYTHKVHEKIADRLTFWLKFLRFADIAIKAVTAAGVIVVLLGNDLLTKVISAILAAVSLFATLYLLKFGEAQEQQIEAHCQSAAKLWTIRERYAALISDFEAKTIDTATVRKQRDELIQELSEIYGTAPRTDSRAYNAARKALKTQEEMTFSHEEIDKFLPPSVRKSKT